MRRLVCAKFVHRNKFPTRGDLRAQKKECRCKHNKKNNKIDDDSEDKWLTIKSISHAFNHNNS